MSERRDTSERRHAPRRRLLTAPLVAVAIGQGGLISCIANGGEVSDPRERTELEKEAGETARSGAGPMIAVHDVTAPAAGDPADDGSEPSTDRTPESAIDDLPVTLRADSLRSPLTAPLEITVTVRNATGGDVRMLLWNTPFEPVLSADLFNVERDGEPRPYRGRKVKRALPPKESDIIHLAPGETLERVVDLSRHYALEAPGTYEIRFVPPPVPFDGEKAGLATLVAADREALVVVRY